MSFNTTGSVGSVGNIGGVAPQPSSSLPAATPRASTPAARASATAEGPGAQARRPSQDQIEKAIESVRQLIEVKAPNELSFSVDETTGKIIVRVSDTKTGDLIRQIPAEELLEIARSLDKLQGLLLRQET